MRAGAFLFAPILLGVGPVWGEAGPDSLIFSIQRKQILERGADERETALLASADELAHEGYYSEALDLLRDLSTPATLETLYEELSELDWDTAAPEAPDTAPPPAAGPRLPRRTLLLLRSEMEYDPWDVHTWPYGGSLQGTLDWSPKNSWVERLSPNLYLSENRVQAGAGARMRAFRRMVRWDNDFLAERRLGQAYGDSSDRVSMESRLDFTTRPLGRAVYFAWPAWAEAERYRRPRSFLASHSILATAPALAYESSDLRKYTRLELDVRQVNYLPPADSADYFRYGPSLAAEFYLGRLSLEGDALAFWYRYPAGKRPRAREWWRGVARMGYRPLSWLQAKVSVTGSYEAAGYSDSVSVINLEDTTSLFPLETYPLDFALRGGNHTLQPSLSFFFGDKTTLSLLLTYARGDYPLLDTLGGRELYAPRYLWESYRSYKPEITLFVLTKRIVLNVGVAHEWSDVAENRAYLLEDSRSFSFSADIQYNVLPWLSADLSGSYLRRVHAAGSPMDDIHVAFATMGFTAKLR